MIKNHYILELKTNEPIIKSGMKNDDVHKVQEWINLWKRVDSNWKISVGMDGDFGPGTLSAVKEFQRYHDLTVDGIIGNNTWRKLTEPMQKAFTRISEKKTLKQLIVEYADQHLNSQPREFKQNEGTWVRAYMDGHEGPQWAWCMGFVQTIIDQAAFTLGGTVTQYMPKTYSCDVVGNHGLKNSTLIRNSDLMPSKIKPGDVFLNVKSSTDWTHTGLVTEVEGDWIHTIEGNTNDEGSREGYEVCARKRNYRTRNIDIFRIHGD